MNSVRFQGKPFNITVIQVYAPTIDAEEAEVDQFYVDPEAFLELAPKKDVLFTIGDWDAKVGCQEIPGVTGKFDLGIQNEEVQSLTEFCQENALVIATMFSQQHKRWLYTWMSPNAEKAMAPHSSTLAWKIPWMEEPGRLQSMGSLRVRYD